MKHTLGDAPIEAAYREQMRGRAIDEIERLRAALERALIGGNHIALYKTDAWPDPDTDPMVALEKLGPGRPYDMWCCWSALMIARRALEGGNER
jgi:hypothetical protein